ncbi:YcnI family protein [uncultured Jatrophihabitans sp.]|uniref:YcnI family copper-binding membrane protein n=1 Tax=uncultured Jatrophihabitans sp. TaxID=1610747 RepID=UPI0035C9A8B9
MHRLRTVALTLLGAFGLLVALSAPALAHVTVTAPGAISGGGDQEITFRVPVEEADANTVGLTVQLPTATPIASVDVAPVPGWTHVQKTEKLAKPIVTDDGNITEAVSQITWTAAKGGGLKPGEYGEFTIIAGQLPKAKSLTFKAIQTYSNGSVVRWIETPAPGSTEEPEHPAPVLELGSASTAGSSTEPSVTATPQAKSADSDGDSNTGPVVLSIIALVVAAAALGLAVVSRAKGRKTA